MPEENQDKLSMTNMIGGGAIEIVDRAIQKALDNINDINTTLERREVMVKIGLTPSSDRTLVEVDLEPKVKLAGQGKFTFSADLRIDGKGKGYAVERNRQKSLPFKNVSHMTGREE